MSPYSGDFESAATEVAGLIDHSVARSVEGQGKVAVAFSGGLDSSIIAKSAANYTDVLACTAYAGRSGDVVRARDAAEALGLSLATRELTEDDVRDALSALALPFPPSLMDRSLWCLYAGVSKAAHGSGVRVLLLGQLADELFGGYTKYAEALRLRGEKAAEAMMSSDFREYPSRGRIRDVAACGALVEPKFPFEAKELGEFATSLPTNFKIRDGERKAVLRRAAMILGVPEKVATAPKKAAQYSSGVQKLVAQLTLLTPPADG